MKGRYLFFAACLGCLAFSGAQGDDDASVARAAARRIAGTTGQTRQKSATTDTPARPTGTATRGTTSAKSGTTTGRTIGARGATTPETGRTSADATQTRTTVTPRTNKTTVTQSHQTNISARAASTISRTATQSRAATTTSRTTATTPRASAIPSRARAATSKTLVRAAENNDLRTAIMGRDYSSCRRVYNECMDEFCANKDAQLKRCACSSRMHEFDKVKKQLSNVEDKLLDFNQRLLTVNMEKEDAAALNVATEGELAFNQKDSSSSKKILDEISKKLNSNSNDSFNQNLTAISLSLNTDAAFDNIDSLMGASTTAKEGLDLYNAALPVCREMAAEVCDEASLSLAESGYQMTIEQDCNTIAKTYENRTDQAREKIREGGALLDMSRLDIYQKRNSDDILTCKKKMLNQLYDTSVCGDGLGKCLDISGQYIDPTTGQAFLTQNLANLSTLISRPTDNQSWTSAPGNDRFVTYLNSKKKYLEPAMENCQDIADYVWTEFIEDALSQIKLAQDKKLEEVRQSCTTLTAQCLSTTATSIAEFDARALSTFGVMADKTVNDMCADVRNACTALLQTTGGAKDWIGGMTEIATDKTYETIMHTCREVGRACIIQACKSISGNFGMCESTQNSVNRKSIINRTSCWPEVKQCVADAGTTAIDNIFKYVTTDNDGTFYTELYGTYNWEFYSNTNTTQKQCHQTPLVDTPHCIHDICADDCGCSLTENTYECTAKDTEQCRVCRLAEKIWGNCEAAPTANIKPKDSHNKILTPRDSSVSTLLSWFAQNTGTTDANDSCRDTTCPVGYTPLAQNNTNIICASEQDFDKQGTYCPQSRFDQFGKQNDDTKGYCCRTGISDNDNGAIAGEVNTGQNCCIGKWLGNTNPETFYVNSTYETTTMSVCGGADSLDNSNIKAYPIVHNIEITINDQSTTVSLVCVSDSTPSGTNTADTYPNGQNIECNGRYIYVAADGKHYDPHNTESFTESFTNSQDGADSFIVKIPKESEGN